MIRKAGSYARRVRSQRDAASMRLPRLLSQLALAALMLATAQRGCLAADKVRIIAQKTGTLAWELDVVQRHGLAQKAELTFETVMLASPMAQKVALKGATADVIVADWIWVARERALGGKLMFHPYSSAAGAVMIPPGSALRSLEDLRGRSIGVGGDAMDKSWALLRALGARQGLSLTRDARISHGAPPLITQKARQREFDAVLTYWNFAAKLKAEGFTTLIDMAEVEKGLGAKGATAMLGYVFDQTWALADRRRTDRFLAVMKEAKAILLRSDEEWRTISPLVGARDDHELNALRDAYRAGVPQRGIAAEAADAGALFKVLVDVGGSELAGPAQTFDASMFYLPQEAS